MRIKCELKRESDVYEEISSVVAVLGFLLALWGCLPDLLAVCLFSLCLEAIDDTDEEEEDEDEDDEGSVENAALISGERGLFEFCARNTSSSMSSPLS